MHGASKRSFQTLNPRLADPSITATFAGGSTNADQIGSERHHAGKVFDGEPAGYRREKTSSLRIAQPRCQPALRDPLEQGGSVLAERVQQHPLCAGVRCRFENHAWRERVRFQRISIGDRHQPSTSSGRSTRGRGDDCAEPRHRRDAGKPDFHDRGAGAGKRRCLTFGEVCVRQIAERRTHRPARRHGGDDLGERRQRHRTQRPGQGLLRVDDVGAAIEGAACLVRRADADQKLHRTGV